MKFGKYIFIALSFAVLLSSCAADGDNPGVEYAPQMYHSVPYEPLTQMTKDHSGMFGLWKYSDNSVPFNNYGMVEGKSDSLQMNMITPPEGTVKRQDYVTKDLKGEFLHYNIHKDSLDLAARTLKNPIERNDAVIRDGKALYTSYCTPCHGAKGDGQGKVGVVYKGVANIASGRIANVTDGHIFHVITHGKGRMWSHKSQLTPEERWKVIHYVRSTLQGK